MCIRDRAIAEAEREAAVGTGGLLLVRGRRGIGQSALLLLADGERERKLLALTLPVDGERHLVAGLTGGDDLHKLAARCDLLAVYGGDDVVDLQSAFRSGAVLTDGLDRRALRETVADHFAAHGRDGNADIRLDDLALFNDARDDVPVSYTHLTLPTT